MFTGGCQAQDQGTEDIAIVTRSPTRSELIKEGKIKVKKKTDANERTTEDSGQEAVPLPETVTQSEGADAYNTDSQQQNAGHYILNTNTRLFHEPSCEKVSYIAPHNYAEFNGTRDELIGQGYSACYTCQQSEGTDIMVTDPNIYNTESQQHMGHYILNTNTKLFHEPSCEKVSYIAPHNYAEFNGTKNELIGQGYSTCYTCDP